MTTRASLITIAAGISARILSLIDDNTTELSESIVVDISSVTGSNGASENGTQQASITLNDNDPVPAVTLFISSRLLDGGREMTLDGHPGSGLFSGCCDSEF